MTPPPVVNGLDNQSVPESMETDPIIPPPSEEPIKCETPPPAVGEVVEIETTPPDDIQEITDQIIPGQNEPLKKDESVEVEPVTDKLEVEKVIIKPDTSEPVTTESVPVSKDPTVVSKKKRPEKRYERLFPVAGLLINPSVQKSKVASILRQIAA